MDMQPRSVRDSVASESGAKHNSGSTRLSLSRTGNRQLDILAIVTVVVVGGIFFWMVLRRPQVQLPAGVTQLEYENVAQKLRRISSRAVVHDEVIFRLGVEQTVHQNWETAAALFASVDPFRSHFGREARYLRAQSVLQQDRLRESEQLFREYLADAPITGKTPWPVEPNREERLMAMHYLSYLLAVELRFGDRQILLAELVKNGDADLFDTLAFHFQSLMEWNNTHGVERLENACRASPHDVKLRAVLAQYRIGQGRLEEAWGLLKVCNEELPSDLTVTAACLTCLQERGDDAVYLKMVMDLPPVSVNEPVELLRHRGQAALDQNQAGEAKLCFQTAIKRDPANVACRLGLAKALLALDEPERRKQELAAAQNLVRIQNRLGWATSKSPTVDILLEIAQLSADAGLQAAAMDLCRISMKLFDASKPFEDLLRDLSSTESKGELQ